MNENEQLEEMAEIIVKSKRCVGITCDVCEFNKFDGDICQECFVAKEILSKGYRKVERGEWIAKPQEFYISDTEWMCSVCKEEFCPTDMTSAQFLQMMKFCPNCGADMRGGDKEWKM